MDLVSLVSQYGPLALAAVGIVAAAAWSVFKLLAPITKTKADDEFIAEHGKQVEDVLDKVKK
jgi:hypothetical protein